MSAFTPTRVAAFAVPLRRAGFPPISKASKSRGQKIDDGLTLEHFLIRTRFLALYRSIVRATREIPNPDARRETLAWYRSDLFPPSLRLERDLVNLKDLLAQGYRQLKQIQGQFTLLGAGGIQTRASGTGDDMAAENALQDPAGYTSLLASLLERDAEERLVLDLRPMPDFAARHLRNATHLPGGWAELNSRFSTYLPARGTPFLVLCLASDETDLRRNLGERDGLIGIVVCRPNGEHLEGDFTSEEAVVDPLGASEASFWKAARQSDVLRSSTAGGTQTGGKGSSPFGSPSGARRSAHTLASSHTSQGIDQYPFIRPVDDVPHLMGQPSPALARTYRSHILPSLARSDPNASQAQNFVTARALDLGCGAGRDLAWLAYRDAMHGSHASEPSASSQLSSSTRIAWRVTGLDNVRPVLERARGLMQAYGLMLPSQEDSSVSTSGFEDLLWAQVSPSGSLLALRSSNSENEGGRNGKPFLAVPEHQENGLLLPQGASAYALALPHGQANQEADPFDLVILVRFLPRTLLWEQPGTIHALVRRGSSDLTPQDSSQFHGGFVLISHFVVPEEHEAITLPPSETSDRPPLRRIFEAPSAPGRLQAREIEQLVETWNKWATADGDGASQGGEHEEWRIVENVIEPIEDGRAVQSVLIQRR
ncbi:hypothetical protein OC845_003771 [Tilletia horrida]|nr:hypothetical protein OC845_003771 [Tilletia horrida]